MLLAGLSMTFVGCRFFDDDTPSIPTVPGIPSDVEATANPTLPDEPNAVIPNLTYSTATVNGNTVIHFDLTGIQDPNDATEWLRLYGTSTINQNVWMEIDRVPKGVAIINAIDETDKQVSTVDLVFLIDNSGSMSQEANTVARDILAWAEQLSTTLDMKFGCVGYDGAITGALNMTSVEELSSYLNKGSGVTRTRHFGGDDADALKNAVGPYRTGGGDVNECGVAALRFANDHFNFRSGANRVYVNFTDEPNQPNGNHEYSVYWVQEPENWPTTYGTIHTVYSNTSTNFTEKRDYTEYPWFLSDFTGGTQIFTNSSFTGVTLGNLPVTGALQNSIRISITNVENLFDGQLHTVRITILSPNGTVRAEREFTLEFTKE